MLKRGQKIIARGLRKSYLQGQSKDDSKSSGSLLHEKARLKELSTCVAKEKGTAIPDLEAISGTGQCDCYPREAVVTERRGAQPGASRRELRDEKSLEQPPGDTQHRTRGPSVTTS